MNHPPQETCRHFDRPTGQVAAPPAGPIPHDGRQAVRFFGRDHEPSRDAWRLGRQLQAVFNVMSDGRWRSIQEAHEAVVRRNLGAGWKVTSIDRQIRYLRDLPGCDVERRYDGNGLYRYRLVQCADDDDSGRQDAEAPPRS